MADANAMNALAALLRGGVQGYGQREERMRADEQAELDKLYKQAALANQMPEMVSPELFNPMVEGTNFPTTSEPISLAKANFVRGAINKTDREKRESKEYDRYFNLYSQKDRQYDTLLGTLEGRMASFMTDQDEKPGIEKQIQFFRKQKAKNARKFKELTGNPLIDVEEYEQDFIDDLGGQQDIPEMDGGATPKASPMLDMILNKLKRR